VVTGRDHVRVSRRCVTYDTPRYSRKFLTPGYPPFCSENAHDVYRKIIDWRNHLYFPDDVHLSREAEDLVRR
jgi:hypothetical protein